MRVLVVEDASPIAELIHRSLNAEGLITDVVTDLATARARLTADPPDVAVVDIELPDGSGLELLREAGADIPIVMLSARGREIDRVVGLELGAADYVTKPFFPRELATRVRRAATAPRARPPAKLDFGELALDVASREVRVHGRTVDLTAREFDLLAHLAAEPGHVFRRDDLLRAVWRSSPEWQTPKTVTEHVRRLRQKIEDDARHPRWIVTVGRVGYRFDPH